MALFTKTTNVTPAPKPRDRNALNSRGIAVDAAISIIASGMVVTGDVVTDGVVRVEGELRGSIRAAKAVLLGPNGRVDGDIFTEEAVIGGTVTGTIVANARLELQSTCAVFGEIISRPQHLKLDEGARFAGEVKLLDAENPMNVLGVDSEVGGTDNRPQDDPSGDYDSSRPSDYPDENGDVRVA
jgi:cytoskeletal protein CcmA (bactofilin family)